MIRLSKSCIGEAEKAAVLRVMDHEFLGMGEDVQKFEEALKKFFGRQTVCVVNGTAALQLALQACGVGSGDEVLVPSLTYVASFQAISSTGAIPVACDIDEISLVLDWKDAERRLTKKTRAVMPVHYTGGVGDLDSLYTFAEKNGLRVVEDAAHALGTIYKSKKVGGFGDISCFSFDGIKNITSGEGGCIVSNDKKLIKIIKDIRLLGIEKDTERRFSGERSWEFDVVRQGWRYHMSNIMAAIGLEQLKRLPEFARKRRDNAKLYDSYFSGHECIKPLVRDYDYVVPHIYVICIERLKNRKAIQKKLLEKGIQTGYHYQPNHWLKYFRNYKGPPLNVTENVFPKLLTLPLHPDMTKTEIEYVASNLIQLLK